MSFSTMTPHLLAGIGLGWSVGASDTANVFGTAVSCKALRLTTASILFAVFVTAGAYIGGRAGIETISALSGQTLNSATSVALGAAMTILLITSLRFSAPSSQAVVGALVGVGALTHRLDISGIPKVLACWIATPLTALLIAMIVYRLSAKILNRLSPTLYMQDFLMRTTLTLVGCYGAYALGANNVANVTAVYVAAGVLDATTAALIGGLSIAFGSLSYSRAATENVSRSMVDVDGFSALIVVLAQSLTVHAFAGIGVPVSSSQALLGAAIGVGLVKQASAVRQSSVVRIIASWCVTPLMAAMVAALIYYLAHLQYVG